MSNMPTDADFQRIKDLIFAGQKIQAIKAYRQLLGADLAEAKAAVEEMTEELKESEPDRFQPKTGKGCFAGAASLLLALAIALAVCG